MYLGIFLFVVGFYYSIKAIGKSFNRFKKEKKYNFYLELHKSQKENNKQYKEYLEYLSKNEPDAIPKEKQKSIDEIWWESKIDELVN